MSQPPKNMKKFLFIWLGQMISIIGSGLSGFALGVWIFQETGQATPFALVVLFSNLPRILLSPVAGSLADRWNRRWLMILADTGSALTTLAVVFLLLGGRLEIWHIYMVAIVSSCFAAFQEPAYAASISMLVPKQDLARANGLVQMSQAIEMLLSPALAGFLFLAVGLRGVFLIDFLTYFFALGALLVVRIPQPELSEADKALSSTRGQVWRDAAFGWSYLRARPGLFMLLLYFAGVNFLLNFASVLTGPLVLSFAGAGALGLLQMGMGVGMLAGSLIMSAWGGTQRRISGIFFFIGLAAVGLALTGTYPSAWMVGAGLFIMLFSVPFGQGMSAAIMQSKVALAVQGRVFAVRTMISRSMMPLAFLLAGPLADRVFEPLMKPGGALSGTFLAQLTGGSGAGRGIGLMFVASGLILLATTVLVYMNPRIRHLEDELPDAVEAAPAAAPAAD